MAEKVGEKSGFLPDDQAVDALKVMFFMGAFVSYYKALELGQPIVQPLLTAAQTASEAAAAGVAAAAKSQGDNPFWHMSQTEKKIFAVGTVVGLNPVVGAQSVAVYRGGKWIKRKVT